MRRWGFDDDEWCAMRRELRTLLVGVARRRGTVTYGEIARRIFDGRVGARSPAIMALADEACAPVDARFDVVLASVIVRSDSGVPGEGYFAWAETAGYDVADRTAFWRAQAERVWGVWVEEVETSPNEAEPGPRRQAKVPRAKSSKKKGLS